MAGKTKEYTFVHHFADIENDEIDEDEFEEVEYRVYKILLDALYEGRI